MTVQTVHNLALDSNGVECVQVSRFSDFPFTDYTDIATWYPKRGEDAVGLLDRIRAGNFNPQTELTAPVGQCGLMAGYWEKTP